MYRARNILHLLVVVVMVLLAACGGGAVAPAAPADQGGSEAAATEAPAAEAEGDAGGEGALQGPIPYPEGQVLEGSQQPKTFAVDQMIEFRAFDGGVEIQIDRRAVDDFRYLIAFVIVVKNVSIERQRAIEQRIFGAQFERIHKFGCERRRMGGEGLGGEASEAGAGDLEAVGPGRGPDWRGALAAVR